LCGKFKNAGVILARAFKEWESGGEKKSGRVRERGREGAGE